MAWQNVVSIYTLLSYIKDNTSTSFQLWTDLPACCTVSQLVYHPLAVNNNLPSLPSFTTDKGGRSLYLDCYVLAYNITLTPVLKCVGDCPCHWSKHTSNDLAEYRHHPSTHLDLYTLDASSVVRVIILTAAPPQDCIELLVSLIAKDEANVVVALVAVNKPRAGEVESAVCSWTWGRRNVLSVQKQQTYLCWGIPHQYTTAMFDNYGISSKKKCLPIRKTDTHKWESWTHLPMSMTGRSTSATCLISAPLSNKSHFDWCPPGYKSTTV